VHDDRANGSARPSADGTRSVTFAPARRTPALIVASGGVMLIGFNTIDLGPLPIGDMVFFGVAGLLCLLLLTGRISQLSAPGARRASPRLLVATLVLLGMATVSTFRSWYPLASAGVVLRLAYLTVLWFWILRCLSVDRRAVGRLMTGWRWGVVIASLGALAANAGLISLGVPNPENRQTAWFGHPNDLAGYLAVAVPVFVIGAPRLVQGAKRHAGLRRIVVAGLVVFALATTGSMSGLMAAAAGLAAAGVAMSLTRRSGRRRTVHPLKAMATITIVGILLTVLFSSDVPVVERLTRLEEGDQAVSSSVGTRGALNERVITQFDDLLVLGHGLDEAAQNDLRGGRTGAGGVHNMFVKLLYEGGFIATLALVAVLWIMLQQAWMLLVNMRSSELHSDVAAVLGGAVAAIVFAMFQPTMFHRHFWLPFAMIQCYWTVRRSELRAQMLASDPSSSGGKPALSRTSASRPLM